MNTIVVSSNKINNDIIPRLSSATNNLQTAYSMSINLKNTLSFNVKENHMSEISSELYNISKELKNITLNISDKVNRIEQIEKKSESKISSIVSKAASIGAITGAATSTLGMQAVIDQQSNKSVSTTDSKMSEIGAKLASEIESKTKNIGTAISNQVERMGAAISKGEVGFATETSNKLEDESNRSDGFKYWTSKALKNTGAFICNTGTIIWNGLKSAWNWITDGENWKRLGASIVNGVLSFVKGLVSLIEAIGDLVVLALGAVVTVGTAIYDTVKGIATGDWSFDATKGLWKKYAVPIVAYSWTNALDESLGWRQHFDQWAYEPFKSDGVGCQILDGVGYVAGIIALTLATFGVGGAAVSAASGAASTATAVTGAAVATGATSTAITAGVTSTTMAITAGAAGIGKGTQEAWQQQIEQANKQQITQELDNIQITEEMFNNKLSELKSQNPENEYTQEDVINAIRSDLYVERTKDLNSWNNIKSGAEKLKGSDIAAGVAYGVGTGVIDGVQWYAGGKINNLFKGANSVVANKFLSSLARVGLDSADAAAEVPLRTLMQSLYRTDENGNKMGFSDVWNENGGWSQVAVQAGVGALGSGIGEGLDAIKGAIATHKIISALDNVTDNTDAVMSKQLSKLSDIDVKKLADKLDDSSKIAVLKNMDGTRFAEYSKVLSNDEMCNIAKHMDAINSVKLAKSLSDSLDDIRLVEVMNSFSDENFNAAIKKIAPNMNLDRAIKFINSLPENSRSIRSFNVCIDSNNDIRYALELMGGINEETFDLIFKNVDNITASSRTAHYIKNMISYYSEGNAAAQGKYKTFFQNFRDHSIGHSVNVAKYTENIVCMMKDADIDEAVYAALAHDFGMRGGYARLDKKIVDAIIAAGGPAYKVGQYIQIDSLSDLNFKNADFLDTLARKNHPLNSAITILSDSRLKIDNIDNDVVALLAMSHSKSTSGIKHFTSLKEWNGAIDRLDDAIKQYNLDNNTNIIFAADSLKQKIKDGEFFSRLQKEALAIRDGDAMSDVVFRTIDSNGTKLRGTQMQDGNVSIVSTREVRENYNTPVLSSEKEYALIDDYIYDSNGTYIRKLSDKEYFSKKIHIGESNVKFDSSYIDGDYTARVTFVNANQSPNASFDAIVERIDEVITYTNCESRKFEIVLPKEAQNKALGNWYEKQLENMKIKRLDQAKIELSEFKITQAEYDSQLDFIKNNIKIDWS